jgi:hypothetical protein
VPLGVAVSAVLGELLPKSSIRPALVAEAPISVGGNAVTLFVDVPPPLAPDVEALLLSAEGSPGNWYSRVRLFFLSNISS